VSLHVVLVEPAGPLNLGSVARLCTNFAVTSLRLVAPRCDPQAPEARRMAVHGLPMLEGAREYPTLAAALADCGRIVATTGRDDGAPLPLLPPAEALAWLVAVPPSPSSSPGATALVFGREDRGLTNQELLQAGRLLRIGTGPAYASLNLSHAVAVVLHELHQLRGAAAAPGQAPSPPLGYASAALDPCRRDQLEAALDDAEALLLEVGFLLPHTRRARMAKLRALLQRGQITAAEVALLRGMVCQLRWASRRGAAATDAP
jgi:tRNA/rRNA methyltransferase